MSHITKMVICAGFGEEAVMKRLNAWCAEHDQRQQQFEALDTEAAGGVKVFVGEVWAMAGNYFPDEKLAEVFSTFGWLYPDDAVLLVYGPEQDGCEIFRAS